MNKLLGSIVITSLLFSSSAHALVPMADWVLLVANLQRTMADKLRAEVDFQRQHTMMDQEAVTAGNQIDGFNNAMANAAVRITKAKADMYTERLKRELLPSATSCQQSDLHYDLDKVLCAATTQLLNLEQAASAIGKTSLVNAKRGSGQVNDVGSAYGYDDTDNDGIVEQSEIDEAATIRALDNAITLPETAALLFSNADSLLTLSPEEHQAAKDLIVLLAPPYQNLDPSTVETPVEKERFVNVSRREASRSTVFNIYNTALANKTSINAAEYAPSPMHYYRKQADVFYGDDEFQETVAFKATTDKVSSPTQLFRYLVTAKALQVDMALKSYENQVKDLNIQAQKLQHALDGLN